MIAEIEGMKGVLIPKSARINTLCGPRGDKLTLSMSNGSAKRLRLGLGSGDFLTRNILKTMKSVLPEELMAVLMRDFAEMEMVKSPGLDSAIESLSLVKSTLEKQDSFSKLATLLLSLLKGEFYSLDLSHQTLSLAS